MILMLVGLPGAGKSTYARGLAKEGWFRVNNDELSEMIFGNYKHHRDAARLLRDVRESLIDVALKRGLKVVLDNTNLTEKGRKRIISLYKPKCKIEALYFPIVRHLAIERRMQEPRGYEREHWANIIDGMIFRMSAPTLKEGFDSVKSMGGIYA